MCAACGIDLGVFLHEQLAQAYPDLMHELLSTFINAVASAQSDSVWRRVGQRGADRSAVTGTGTPVTRPGTIDVAIPKLWEGTFFPE